MTNWLQLPTYELELLLEGHAVVGLALRADECEPVVRSVAKDVVDQLVHHRPVGFQDRSDCNLRTG